MNKLKVVFEEYILDKLNDKDERNLTEFIVKIVQNGFTCDIVNETSTGD